MKPDMTNISPFPICILPGNIDLRYDAMNIPQQPHKSLAPGGRAGFGIRSDQAKILQSVFFIIIINYTFSVLKD